MRLTIILAVVTCRHSCWDGIAYSERCDNRAIEQWTTDCIHTTSSTDDENLPASCRTTAQSLFCELRQCNEDHTYHWQRPWVWRDGEWEIKR
jgi:glucose dehydrogenase